MNIDELVVLAKENILAADQYKGKLIAADGIVVSVDENKILVGGLVSSRGLIMSGWLELINDGFTCHYSEADRSEAVQLRGGDLIKVTGMVTGWETTFQTNAQLGECQFSKISSEVDYEGCLRLALLIPKLIPMLSAGMPQLVNIGDDAMCNQAIGSLNKPQHFAQ